jgi:uncharacterized protein
MHCPVCKTVNLMMADRQGIEIDYCPQCRGVWLDRGELDKIIERSAGAQIPSPAVTAPSYAPPVQSQPPVQSPPPPQYRGDERHHDSRNYGQPHYDSRDHKPYDSRHHDKDHRYGHKRKREGFLSDLFDFD